MSLEIKSKLQSLLTAANTKTGESDTTLTDAVQTLVDGYGQGGAEVEVTDYSLTEDWSTNDLGNTQNFYNTFRNKGDGIYVFIILNNGIANSDLYKAISAVSWTGITRDPWAISRRVFNDVTQVNTTMGFHMSTGSRIRQYFIPKEVFGL